MEPTDEIDNGDDKVLTVISAAVPAYGKCSPAADRYEMPAKAEQMTPAESLTLAAGGRLRRGSSKPVSRARRSRTDVTSLSIDRVVGRLNCALLTAYSGLLGARWPLVKAIAGGLTLEVHESTATVKRLMQYNSCYRHHHHHHHHIAFV